MKRILTALLALTAAAAPLTASAGDHGRGKGNGHYKKDRDDRRDERRAYRQGYREGQRDARPYVNVRPRGYAGRPAYAPPRYWSRGQVLPSGYRGGVIYDPYRYGLYAPPRGHAWMHVGNDVYLTSLASGVIVEVLRDSYY